MKNFHHRHYCAGGNPTVRPTALSNKFLKTKTLDSRLRGNDDIASFFGFTISLNSRLNLNLYGVAPPCPDLDLIRCQTAKGRLKTCNSFSDGLF